MKEQTPEHKTEQELELELEKVRTGRLEAEHATAQSAIEVERLRVEREQKLFGERFAHCLAATGLKPYCSPEDLLSVLRTRYDIVIHPSGSFEVRHKNSGNLLDFDKAMDQFAREKKVLFETGSLKRIEEKRPLTRADLRTTAEKSAYISEHGLAKFEALDAKPSGPTSSNVLTMSAAAYSKLSLSQKSKIIDEYGNTAIEEILRRR
jgi:hypothetical protein